MSYSVYIQSYILQVFCRYDRSIYTWKKINWLSKSFLRYPCMNKKRETWASNGFLSILRYFNLGVSHNVFFTKPAVYRDLVTLIFPCVQTNSQLYSRCRTDSLVPPHPQLWPRGGRHSYSLLCLELSLPVWLSSVYEPAQLHWPETGGEVTTQVLTHTHSITHASAHDLCIHVSVWHIDIL